MNIEKNIQSSSENNKKYAGNIAIIDEHSIREKIYEIRGVKVMLDFDLAEIYGYETKNFNRQVKNNAAKFEGDDFMFQLSRKEVDDLVRCNNFTSRAENLFKGQSGGSRYLPHAFTEQGIYMLMTVLRGDLAIKQNRALVMAFKAMKDYIVDTQGLAEQRDLLRLSIQTTENTEAIKNVQSLLTQQQKLLMEHDDKLVKAFEQISETVRKSEISPVLLQFQSKEQTEFLLMNGKPAYADVTYAGIYNKARKSVFLIDNYINLKTLHLLHDINPGVTVTIFSDNLQHKLHASDFTDFQIEFPSISIKFLTTAGIVHDRYIVLDYGEQEERIYLCGSSSKDSGVAKMSTITELQSTDIKQLLHAVIEKMKLNPPLVLR